ncbi:MAG: tRNA (adenosine(37)-N6)-threonylcarbamoyltransferase complex dimerization subunit type 1 TsaB [Clostridia bacterium]|nr:tRNA (adenosine(37)-N6)-threonylcarbamoyltransferase complex dimerization subunit type 1 TsaB [Clostridia bacterium]
MIILAIESSALTASVAVYDSDRLLGEYTVNNGNTHSETLLPMVESLLGFLNLSVSDVELFAVSAGPGSFTGIRIGVATLKGLAFGSGKPCVGVSTLEAMAYRLQAPNGLICPVMNARRKQVYTALFREQNGELLRLMPDSAIAIEELDKTLSQYNEPVYLIGDGYTLAAQNLTHALGYTPEHLRCQSAASVAKAAWKLYQAGQAQTDKEIKPVYLRPCQAERERLERESNQRKVSEHEAK